MGKGGKKDAGKSGGKGSEIFQCDYCFMFEGTFALVAKHEKTCKPYFDMLCKRAGTYEEPQIDKGGNKDSQRASWKDAERESGEHEKSERSQGRTAKEKRQNAKKRRQAALGRAAADESLDQMERVHLDVATEREEHEERTATGAAAAAASSTRDGNGPPSKAERRKAEKRKRKEAVAAAKASADGANHDEDDGGPRAKLAKLAPAKAAVARESVLRKGVRILELSAGSGPVVEDRKRVKVKYIGRLDSPTGAVFDQGTLAFRLGKGEVIQGWDIGVQGMRVGSKRRITVPPAAGYGKSAAPGGKIPPNSTLCFDVAVV